MSHAKNKVNWCLNKAERELSESKKHRGLVKIETNLGKAKEHLIKAEHNLKTTLYLQRGGYTDWCSSTLFYTIYHCFLSILTKFGYESRNQECTFALINSFIEDGLINISKEDLDQVSNLNIEETQHSPRTAIEIREEFQYSTKLSLQEETFQPILDLAKRILDQTKLIVES